MATYLGCDPVYLLACVQARQKQVDKLNLNPSIAADQRVFGHAWVYIKDSIPVPAIAP